MKRRNIDVRLGVDRDLEFSALVAVQGTNRTENLPPDLLSQPLEVLNPEKTAP